MQPKIKNMAARLMAIALVTAGALTTAQAQTALQAHIVLRPVSAWDVSLYKLPSTTELSGGLDTVGVGTAEYLEVEVNTNFPAANITNVTWSVIAKPLYSTPVLTNSPLGINVPIYEPSDRLAYQVAGQLNGKTYGRALFRPDQVSANFVGGSLLGQKYTVQATVYTTTGATNLTQNITAGTYEGASVCLSCHSSPGAVAPDKSSWLATLHAVVFSNEIDGAAEFASAPMRQSCLQCHTTGFSANTNVADGGFSSMQLATGWTIPAVLTNGNYVSMQQHYPTVAAIANVQCESCHGPGSMHLTLAGNTNYISVNYTSGDCNQCHDDATHHAYGTEWLNSVHAVTTTDPAGNSSCVGCHTGKGFIARVEGITSGVDTSYDPIGCQACHEPHGDTIPTNNPHMIRTLASVTFQDGTVVTNGGEGLLCMECHQSRQNAATYASNPNNASSHFGPHHGTQGDMLEGVNAYTFGQVIPSSAHANAVSNTCVTCHMQTLSSSDPNLLLAGGHTFNMATNSNDLVAACQQCHGPSVSSFNFPLQDYDGDGVVEGVQTEVQHLLNKVAMLLPGGTNNVINNTVTPAKTWTAPQVEAAYNYLFVQSDGSLGIHNTAYAVGLLKASIANLTGDANNDGLPDAWQTNYFGSINNPAAAPNAINNAAGVPNWMMYALGLAPTAGFTVDNSGRIYFDGNNIVNGATNTIAIYRAAEIAFNTTPGVYYQIQGISDLSGGWTDISTNIPGTGGSISYLTPTRNNAQMFFRVMSSSPQ